MKAKRGRPSLKDNPDVVNKIKQLAQDGKIDREIAEIIGIKERTLNLWKEKDWEFYTCLKENKQIANEMVEASAFKRALGFENTVHTEKSTVKGEVVQVAETTYYPPDPTSIIFFLKNRDPNKWKDRREEEHKVLILKQEMISNMSDEDILKESERILALINQKKVIDVQDSSSEGE
jgi:hypothetical protein